ncbi:MAG TPA: PstS family phosphate ABC transporter substrate-binding protein [Hyphomicrobiales bacterium]|nr:PstS family phosphate ABC transporter substrate-binding protein [Hyphomicrobiales bacterium]
MIPTLSMPTLRGAVLVLAATLAGCSGDASQDGDSQLTGAVSLDGSSTVFPISEAVAEEFLAVAPRVRVTVGVSGTGGGFKKFIAGEIDINDASRPIKGNEITEAQAKGLRYLEVPVAYDGLSIVVNPANDWVDYLTVEELKMIWEPGSTVDSWDDIRAGWPAVPLRLYGPGTDSGTFDYFTEAVNGASGASRPDYTASEDDNVLVQGISGDESALGFFGFAYYEENASRLKLVPVDGGNGPVAPSAQSINDGSYSPLSRPIYIYLSAAAMVRPEVRAFVDFYLDNAPALSMEVGYIPLRDEEYAAAKSSVADFQ